MTDEELIARLRDAPADGLGTENLCLEAADRIEALTAKIKLMDDLDAINGEKIEALTKERDDAVIKRAAWELEARTLTAKLATCEKYRDAYDEMGRIGTQAVRDLEGKLAKAEAGLLAIAKRDEQMIWGEDYEVEEAFKDMRDIALATLAAVTETHKIKGESHE